MITYTKLKSGEWGIRLQNEPKVGPGRGVLVTTKAGKVKTERVKCVVWTNNADLQICAVEQREQRNQREKCAECNERPGVVDARDLSGLVAKVCHQCKQHEGELSFA